MHVKALKMHFLASHRGGGGHPMSNVVEEKWGEMGKIGGEWGKLGGFLHILLQNGGDLNVKAPMLALLLLL